MRFDQQSFIKSFLEFRKRTSISQETIAKLLGTQKRTVTSWERGKSVPKFVLVQKFYALEKLSQEELYALMAELAQFYRRCLLKTKEAEIARKYLEERDLGEKVCEDFVVGYVPKKASVCSGVRARNASCATATITASISRTSSSGTKPTP